MENSVVFVNNSLSDVSAFYPVLLDCINNGKSLPEELSDLFVLKIIRIDGKPRGILTAA